MKMMINKYMKNRNFALTFLCVISFILTSCKSKLKDEEIVPPEQSYNAGIIQIEKGEYKKAAEDFERVFFQHPGNVITPQAELMQAYSLYLAAEYDDAVDVLDIFIKLHPRHDDIAYAYYLKAMSNYAQISSVLLDQSRTRAAKEDFEEVINRFSGTKYAIDAALKIDLVNDHLAGKEMLVGRYYLKKKNPISAVKRFQTVIDEYDTTSHVEEALYRLVEANIMLGLESEAEKYNAVLEYNYPNGIWIQKARNLLK
jgi:outer membrane protein assembly factor BamD